MNHLLVLPRDCYCYTVEWVMSEKWELSAPFSQTERLAIAGFEP